MALFVITGVSIPTFWGNSSSSSLNFMMEPSDFLLSIQCSIDSLKKYSPAPPPLNKNKRKYVELSYSIRGYVPPLPWLIECWRKSYSVVERDLHLRLHQNFGRDLWRVESSPELHRGPLRLVNMNSQFWQDWWCRVGHLLQMFSNLDARMCQRRRIATRKSLTGWSEYCLGHLCRRRTRQSRWVHLSVSWHISRPHFWTVFTTHGRRGHHNCGARN